MLTNKEISDLTNDAEQVYGYEPSQEDIDAFEDVYEKQVQEDIENMYILEPDTVDQEDYRDSITDELIDEICDENYRDRVLQALDDLDYYTNENSF
jgi:hypothetical protein